MSALLDRQGRPDPKELLRQTQRGRLMAATADVIAEKGYAATTVADIVACAKVSRRTFYEFFSDREAALLATHEAVTGVVVEELAAVREPTAAANLRVSLERFLALIAADPAPAHVALVDILAAGDVGRTRYQESSRRFAMLLAAVHARARREGVDVPDLGPAAFTAVAGGINRVVTDHVLDGRAQELPRLIDEVDAFAAAVLFGTRA